MKLNYKKIRNYILDELDNFVEEVKALFYIGEKDCCDNSITFICDYLDRTEGGCWGYDKDKGVYIDFFTNRKKKAEEV